MDEKRVDMMFFGPETLESLKRDVRDLTKLLSVIDNKFERKMCEQTLKGKQFLFEQETCLQEKRK